jgi:hypothetical protein
MEQDDILKRTKKQIKDMLQEFLISDFPVPFPLSTP